MKIDTYTVLATIALLFTGPACSPSSPATLMDGDDDGLPSLADLDHTNPVELRFSPTGDIQEGVLTALGEANATLDVAMYSMSDRRVKQALFDLAASGVRVRMILNSAHINNRSLASDLEAAGVDVRYIIPVMHHKFAIVDGGQTGDLGDDTVLVTGSANWSGSAFSKYDEDWLRYEGESPLIQAFQVEFNEMWDHAADFAGLATSDPTEDISLDDAAVNVWFTSANFEPRSTEGSFRYVSDMNVVADQLIMAIDQAQTSIEIGHAHFRKRDIYEAVERAHERGVAIRMVLDQQEFRDGTIDVTPGGGNLYYEEQLFELGVEVRYKTYSRYWDYRTAKQFHTKYLIIDETWVLTGSYNLSDNAERATFENLVSIDDPSIVGRYSKHFDHTFSLGDGTFPDLLNEIQTNDGEDPCHFESISLTGPQIRELREQYVRDACLL